MTELFLDVVNMSISAGWIVLAVLALRLILKKAPKWGNVLLWGIVAVRLICPFSIESALSLIPSRETISPEIMMDWTPEISTGIEPLDQVVNPVISTSFAPNPAASANPLQILIPVAANLWLLGVLILLAYTAISYLSLRLKLRTAVILRDNIFQCETVSSPFVLGILKPKIYLPYSMDGNNLNHVVAHEQAHIKRKDHWWKPLGFLLLTVYWFNPLMWLAYILLCRDIELACDEKVIAELGSEQRADYTQALVACAVNRRMIAACPLAFGEVGVKDRVKSVMNYRKPTFWIIVTALIVCVVVAVCFLTDPVAEDPLYYWTESYLRDIEQTEVHKAYNMDSKPLPVTIKFESTSGPLEIELTYGFKKSGEDKWLYSDPVKLHLGETLEFTVPADNHFNVTAMPLSGQNGNVSFRFTEGLDMIGDPRKVIEWFDYTENPSEMSYEKVLKIQLEDFPDITFKYTPYDIIATTSWEDSETAGNTFLISGMPIWNAYFSDLTGDGKPEICSQVSYGSGIIDNRVIIFDYANGVSYKLEDRGYHDYYLRMEGAYLHVDKKFYNSDELVSSGRLIFKDGCIQIEGVPSEPMETPAPEQGFEGSLNQGLNAEIVEIDSFNQILYVKDIDVNAEVFGERCAIDCNYAISRSKLIYVNYDYPNDVRTIEFSTFEAGDAIIIGIYESEKEKAFNGSAIADQVQLSTQRLSAETAFSVNFAGNTSLQQEFVLTEDRPYWCILVENHGTEKISTEVGGEVRKIEPGTFDKLFSDEKGKPGTHSVSFATSGSSGMTGNAVCYTYKYRIEITGRLHNAVKDTTYILLTNIEGITFEQAWKASGLSSNTDDYFDPADAVFIGIR